jgi:hypothetical protein
MNAIEQAIELLSSAHVATNKVWERNECVEGLKRTIQSMQPAKGPNTQWLEDANPLPPPPPPPRTVGFFGETRESIRARREYEIYMRGWQQGFAAARPRRGMSNVNGSCVEGLKRTLQSMQGEADNYAIVEADMGCLTYEVHAYAELEEGQKLYTHPQSPAVPDDVLVKAAAYLHQAAEDVAGWGAYASEYFQNKHDLKFNIALYHQRAAEIEAMLSAQENSDEIPR